MIWLDLLFHSRRINFPASKIWLNLLFHSRRIIVPVSTVSLVNYLSMYSSHKLLSTVSFWILPFHSHNNDSRNGFRFFRKDVCFLRCRFFEVVNDFLRCRFFEVMNGFLQFFWSCERFWSKNRSQLRFFCSSIMPLQFLVPHKRMMPPAALVPRKRMMPPAALVPRKKMMPPAALVPRRRVPCWHF